MSRVRYWTKKETQRRKVLSEKAACRTNKMSGTLLKTFIDDSNGSKTKDRNWDKLRQTYMKFVVTGWEQG